MKASRLSSIDQGGGKRRAGMAEGRAYRFYLRTDECSFPLQTIDKRNNILAN
jgi:hypothetical protein